MPALKYIHLREIGSGCDVLGGGGGVTYIYIQNWIIVELPRPPPFWGKYRRNEKKNNEIKTEIEGKGILCTQVCTMVPAGCTGLILPTDSFKEYGNNKVHN